MMHLCVKKFFENKLLVLAKCFGAHVGINIAGRVAGHISNFQRSGPPDPFSSRKIASSRASRPPREIRRFEKKKIKNFLAWSLHRSARPCSLSFSQRRRLLWTSRGTFDFILFFFPHSHRWIIEACMLFLFEIFRFTPSFGKVLFLSEIMQFFVFDRFIFHLVMMEIIIQSVVTGVLTGCTFEGLFLFQQSGFYKRSF